MKKLLILLSFALLSVAAIAQNKVVLLIDDFQIAGDSSYIEGRTFFKEPDGRLVPTQSITLNDAEACDSCVYSSSEVKYLLGVRDDIMNARYEEFKVLLEDFGNLSLEVHQDTLWIKGSKGLIIKTE